MMKSKVARRLSTVMVAGALAIGGIAVTAAPAMAGGNGGSSVSLVRAEAWTSTWSGTQGRSYAQHGCASALSQWFSATSNAYASCGLSGGKAWYEFR